jgi:hypothetical protein
MRKPIDRSKDMIKNAKNTSTVEEFIEKCLSQKIKYSDILTFVSENHKG